MGSKNISGNKFNEDFKKMVVDLYRTGSSVKDLSGEYGVSEVTIYKWIKRFSPIELENGTVATSDDFVKLQKQILRLQEENEILKKAMAIFARK
jgi:transposase